MMMIPYFISNDSLIRLNNRMRLLDAIRELFAPELNGMETEPPPSLEGKPKPFLCTTR